MLSHVPALPSPHAPPQTIKERPLSPSLSAFSSPELEPRHTDTQEANQRRADVPKTIQRTQSSRGASERTVTVGVPATHATHACSAMTVDDGSPIQHHVQTRVSCLAVSGLG